MPKRRSQSAPARPAFSPPYPPGWVDRLTDRVERLPGPPWITYLGWGIATYLLVSAVQWSAGTYAIGTFRASHAVGAFLGAYAVGMIHYLDRSAVGAMNAFRPALEGDDALFHRLSYTLTTLPRGSTLAASLGAMMAGLLVAGGAAFLQPSESAGAAEMLTRLNLGTALLFGVSPSPLSYAVTIGLLALNWWVGGALILHTVRRLTLVPRIYRRHTKVDLFRQAPLYALSRLTAQTTIGALLLVYALASVPTYISQPLGGGTIAFFIGLALACFALPLMGVHRILADEKERLLQGIGDRLHEVGEELHRRVAKGSYQGMDGLHKALSGLEIQRNMLSALPTWPWAPETFRTLLIALLFPLIVWVTQTVLQRVLG